MHASRKPSKSQDRIHPRLLATAGNNRQWPGLGILPFDRHDGYRRYLAVRAPLGKRRLTTRADPQRGYQPSDFIH